MIRICIILIFAMLITGCGYINGNYACIEKLIDSGDYDVAIKHLDEIIEDFPKNAYAYSVRGICYWYVKDPQKAIEDLEQAISLGDTAPRTFQFCAWSYGLQQKDMEALRVLNQAIEMQPNEAGHHFFRACTYYELGNYDQALTDLDKTVKIDPQHKQVTMLREKIAAELERN